MVQGYLSNSEIALELTKTLLIHRPDLFSGPFDQTANYAARVYRGFLKELDHPSGNSDDLDKLFPKESG